jgi:hypothetical protein
MAGNEIATHFPLGELCDPFALALVLCGDDWLVSLPALVFRSEAVFGPFACLDRA